MDERYTPSDVGMARANEPGERRLGANQLTGPANSRPDGAISPTGPETPSTGTGDLRPAPADTSSPITRRILVRAAAVRGDRLLPATRRRRRSTPSVVPSVADEGAVRVGHAVAPLLVSDLRPAVLAPIGRRLAVWLAGVHRAIVALGVRSLVHPIAIVLYAMIVGALLRSFRIATNPPGLNQDEAVAGYDAWSLWLTLRDHHGNTLPIAGFLSFGDWVSPFLSFYLVPIVGIFGLDVTTVRTGTVLLGIAAIPFTYLLTVELTGRRGTGAAAAWFLAISPWAVHLTRFAIPPATVLLLLPMGLWLTMRAIRTKTMASVVLAGFVLGFAVIGYPTMKLYVPLIGVVIALLYAQDWLAIPLRNLTAGVLAFGVTAGPNLLFSFRDPDASNRQRFLSVFNRDDLTPGFFAEQYWSYVNPHYLFVNRNENDAADAASRFTTELSWTLPFLVIGAVAIIARALRLDVPLIYRRPAILLLSTLVLAPVPGMFTTTQNGSRETQLIVLLAMTAGIGLVALRDVVHLLAGRFESAPLRTVTAAVVILMLLAPLGVQARNRYHGYFQDYPLDYGVQRFFHTGLIGAAEYAYMVRDDYDTIWFVDTNQGYTIFLLVNQFDPNIVHNDLEISGQDFGSYLVNGIGKFRFNGVYVGLPDDVIVSDQHVVYESFPFETGRGYVARAGQGPDGRPILVISSEVRS